MEFSVHHCVVAKRSGWMEIFFDILKNGKLKIELSVSEHNGWSVVFTASDEEDRRILKAPIMHNGKVKIYKTAEEAIADAMQILSNREINKQVV